MHAANYTRGVALNAANAELLRRVVAARGRSGDASFLGVSPTLLEKLEDGGTARPDAVARLVRTLTEMT